MFCYLLPIFAYESMYIYMVIAPMAPKETYNSPSEVQLTNDVGILSYIISRHEAIHRLLVAASPPPPYSEGDKTLWAPDDRRLDTSIQKGRSDINEKHKQHRHCHLACVTAFRTVEGKDPCMAVECSTLEAKHGRHHVGHAVSHARNTLADHADQRLETVPINVVCEYGIYCVYHFCW